MKRFNLNIILAFIFILASLPLFATVIPIQLDQRIESSGQIILAKVINASSYWTENKQNINTTYTMEAIAYLKEANVEYTFQLILPGGEIDGEMEVVSPNVQMEIGKEYLVLVENAPKSIQNPNSPNTASRVTAYRPYAFVQGVLPYLNEEYSDFTSGLAMDEKTLMTRIKKITKKDPITPKGEIYKPREKIVDKDKDGVCSTLDCDDGDADYPLPIGAHCNDGNPATQNDKIQADGCTCAGNPGTPVNCDDINIIAEGSIIRIDNLTAKSEKIEIIGSETNGLATIICNGDCKETEFIEGLIPGNKSIRIWMYGENETGCYKEFIIQVGEFVCPDPDGDNLCNIKDCAPDNGNYPAIPGTPCDDGLDNTIRDIILADGCSCAGVETCLDMAKLKNTAAIRNSRRSIIIKNGAGAINPVFPTGTLETDNELVIEGNGFGSTAGTIQFQNSDSGGRSLIEIDQATDITSWTDTNIQVKIPSKAGTGEIYVKNSSGTIVETGNIIISYAINSLHSSFRSFPSKTKQSIKFTDRNEAGGFTIQLNSSSGFASSTAVPPLERAINSWICNSGVNWQLDKTGTTTGFGNDGFCLISYEPNLPIGVLAITTSRYKASGNTSCSEYNTVWYLKEFDIQFLPNASLGSYTWNYAEWPPQNNQYDFETIALHELGHAHGLGHVINNDEIMHFSIASGSEIRNITPLTQEGSQYKIGIATQPNCISSHVPMTLLTPNCTPTEPPSTSARIKIMLEGFYDKTNKNLKTNLLANNLIPTNHPFNVDPYNYSQTVTISNFPANAVDWLLLELRDENDMNIVIAQKPVLVNSDGSIIDVSGNSLITFENLADKNYYIVVIHKSHLPVISNTAQPLNDDPSIFDFSISANTTMGVEQQKLIDTKYFMSSGDFDGNGIINSLDFNLWKQAGAAVNFYSPVDADGNGIINSLDFNLWKTNSSKVSVLQRSN